jgi:hypothetical protein
LVWWIRDHQNCGFALDAADFDAVPMNQASEMKTLTHKQADKEPSPTNLEKYYPNDFDAHEDVFMNILALLFGVLKEPLR